MVRELLEATTWIARSPDDAEPLRALKARMRWSLRRELAWALAGIGVLVVLLRTGWRPWT